MRLDALIAIGRSLDGGSDLMELRRRVLARMSLLFGSDRLFCAETDAAGETRLVLLVAGGSAQRADETYAAATDAATPETGRLLDAESARAILPPVASPDGGRGALVVPIRAGDRFLGEIGAVRALDAEPFGVEDAELLSFGAAILATAFAQRQRIEETDTRRREAERLEEIGRAITSSLELPQVLERVTQAVLDLTNADVCSVWRRDGDSARVVASRGRGAMPMGFDLELAPQIVAGLVSRRESIQIEDLSADPRLPAGVRARIAGDGPRSAILVPMVCADAVVGVLAVGHHERRSYDADAMGILERLALQAAIAAENARLHAEIRELSLTDPLTGLPNRRHMEMVLATEFEAARRGRTLSVVLFDLDGFKEYNDTHGHSEGDEALRQFAFILISETRAMNLAVRYGGDEFIVILSESNVEGAAHLIERVKQRVRENPLLEGVGVSAGVAQFRPEMRSPRALVEAADEAMYRSKSA